MSQWEECLLDVATHVEMGGKVHELGIGDGSESKHPNVIKQVIQYNRYCIEVYMESGGWQRIHACAFPLLGIKCLRKKKREPIEFEAAFAKYDGNWRFLYSLDDGSAYQNLKKKKFRCVEIMEDEE
jgi:hypothetical protein